MGKQLHRQSIATQYPTQVLLQITTSRNYKQIFTNFRFQKATTNFQLFSPEPRNLSMTSFGKTSHLSFQRVTTNFQSPSRQLRNPSINNFREAHNLLLQSTESPQRNLVPRKVCWTHIIICYDSSTNTFLSPRWYGPDYCGPEMKLPAMEVWFCGAYVYFNSMMCPACVMCSTSPPLKSYRP